MDLFSSNVSMEGVQPITNSFTMDLFSEPVHELEVIRLNMEDADIIYYPHFFSKGESDDFYKLLLKNILWQQDSIQLYGKKIPLPRLTAWYGEVGKPYTYSGIPMQPHYWTKALLSLKNDVEEVSGVDFTSVLLNLYRNGNDSVAWHADDEKELGKQPIIASLSFGAVRTFQFKHKTKPHLKHKIALQHGSLLLMKGDTQQYWLHQIPKTTQPVEPRINLTFRVIQ
jgi:alkylated DNA repair dioxygenase AlkB